MQCSAARRTEGAGASRRASAASRRPGTDQGDQRKEGTGREGGDRAGGGNGGKCGGMGGEGGEKEKGKGGCGTNVRRRVGSLEHLKGFLKRGLGKGHPRGEEQSAYNTPLSSRALEPLDNGNAFNAHHELAQCCPPLCDAGKNLTQLPKSKNKLMMNQ